MPRMVHSLMDPEVLSWRRGLGLWFLSGAVGALGWGWETSVKVFISCQYVVSSWALSPFSGAELSSPCEGTHWSLGPFQL